MGCSVSVRGTMNVRDNPEVEKVFDSLFEYDDFGYSTRCPPDAEGYSETDLDLSASMSYTTLDEIKEKLRTLIPHLREPACFKFVVDDEQYEFWVGEEEAISKARRQRRMQELAEKVRNLSDEEIFELLGLADKSHFVNSSR